VLLLLPVLVVLVVLVVKGVERKGCQRERKRWKEGCREEVQRRGCWRGEGLVLWQVWGWVAMRVCRGQPKQLWGGCCLWGKVVEEVLVLGGHWGQGGVLKTTLLCG
jgi:hypothetical protein